MIVALSLGAESRLVGTGNQIHRPLRPGPGFRWIHFLFSRRPRAIEQSHARYRRILTQAPRPSHRLCCQWLAGSRLQLSENKEKHRLLGSLKNPPPWHNTLHITTVRHSLLHLCPLAQPRCWALHWDQCCSISRGWNSASVSLRAVQRSLVQWPTRSRVPNPLAPSPSMRVSTGCRR